MSTLMELAVVLLLCPTLLALWLDARYPRLRPKQLGHTVLHLGLSGLIGFIVMRPLMLGVTAVLDGAAARAVSIALACTVIFYALLVTMWVMRSAAELARAGR